MRVVVAGGQGRMAAEALRALTPGHGVEVAGVLSREAGVEVGGCVAEDDLATLLARTEPDVLLDLSHRSCAASNALVALDRGVRPVIGVTGLTDAEVAEIARAATSLSALIVPNFALGAILLMRFAETAARFLPDCEIIERHHDRKEDAPSGTALETARRISAVRPRPRDLPAPHLKIPGARGASAGGVPIHSLRLPGSLAHQEVLFGGDGETLTLRHDSLDRSSFAEGMRIACRKVPGLTGLHTGLDAVLDP